MKNGILTLENKTGQDGQTRPKTKHFFFHIAAHFRLDTSVRLNTVWLPQFYRYEVFICIKVAGAYHPIFFLLMRDIDVHWT